MAVLPPPLPSAAADPQCSGPMTARPGPVLSGRMQVPGDKSISHRALILGALAAGRTHLTGLLESADVMATARAVCALGASVRRKEDGWEVTGVGLGGLQTPAEALDFGNSGTGARLMLGVLSTHPINAMCVGDASLSRRPMDRVLVPLEACGARFQARPGGLLPIAVAGARDPLPLTCTLRVASAQVKSALLLAGLNAPGVTTVTEPAPTRDHTERLLRHFGAGVDIGPGGEGTVIRLAGQPELQGAPCVVPGDPSSAAFPMVAALVTPGSDVLLEGMMVNETRLGLVRVLQDMGGSITLENRRAAGAETVADVRVRASALRGVETPPERAPSMIDDYPALAVAAAFARGPTCMRGLAELRIKESDRLAAMAAGLEACGVRVGQEEAALRVEGTDGAVPGGAQVAARGDHRIAMAFLMLGLAAREAVTIDDGAMIGTSFPGFGGFMAALGAGLERTGAAAAP